VHVTVACNDHTRRHVTNDASDQNQTVNDAQGHRRHRTSVPLSQVRRQVLADVDVRSAVVASEIRSRRNRIRRRSEVRHRFCFTHSKSSRRWSSASLVGHRGCSEIKDNHGKCSFTN